MPTISPARTVRSRAESAAPLPSGASTVNPRSTRRARSCGSASRCTVGGSSPSASRASARTSCTAGSSAAWWATTLPRRSTVTSSAKRVTSSRWWVTTATATPSSWARRDTRVSSASASRGARTAVGSSRISTRGLRSSTRRSSSRWRSPTDSDATRASSGSSMPRARPSSSARARSGPRRSTNPVASPRARFSRAVSEGTSMKCWCTIARPRRIASRAVAGASGPPSTDTTPRSGSRSPAAMRSSVDLPAPFSPTMAWTRPGSRCSEAPSRATASPNLLSMPVSVTAATRAL